MGVQQATLDQAVTALRLGAPAIFPTDTVFGLGVSVQHAGDPRVLFRLKGRSEDKPVAWLVGGKDDILHYGQDVPSWALRLADAYWPGPLTLVVPASDAVSAPFRSAKGTIGLRMPDNATVLQLIQSVGCPLATTSANLSGEPPVFLAGQLNEALADAVGVVLSDDLPKSGASSTVVDCTGPAPVVLREGSISLQDVGAC